MVVALTALLGFGLASGAGIALTGSANPYNMVRATFNALTNQYSPRMVATRRGKKVGEIIGRRRHDATADTREASDG